MRSVSLYDSTSACDLCLPFLIQEFLDQHGYSTTLRVYAGIAVRIVRLVFDIDTNSSLGCGWGHYIVAADAPCVRPPNFEEDIF